MPEWSTYSLSDFLMFSPQAYWRLVARYNEAWWPAQWLAVAAVLTLPLLARQRAGRTAWLAWIVLAAAWAWLAWAWYAQRYAEIFLAAPWIALACALQALLLLAGAGARRTAESPRRGLGRVGWVLLAAALLYPLLAPLTGHRWSEAEVFAFLPEPTALATLGVLAASRAWPAWLRALLAVIPVLSLLLGAATRWLIAQ